MTLASLALAATLASAGAGTPAEQGNLCTLCHPDVRVAFQGSVHHAEGVACTACHGGDAAASTVEGAHARGFRGVPPRREIPALCATCHSDMVRMKAYNLPADQYALYQTSRHGQRLAQGDDKVAVCTDCHATHDILPPSNPKSRVHPRNIPATCARCHSDMALMERYGLRSDPYADYKEGVHGKALLEQGNDSAPQCARCHGAHGATPPGVGNIEKLCGQCHVETREYFARSPHEGTLVRAGYAECASCHGHHRILKTSIDALAASCAKCHGAGSAEELRAVEIRTLYTAADEQVARARALVAQAEAIPLYVEDYQARLQEASTALMETHQVMHAVDTTLVEDLARRARSIGNEVESELTGKIDGLRWRRVYLLFFWFYLLVTVGILVGYRRRAMAKGPR